MQIDTQDKFKKKSKRMYACVYFSILACSISLCYYRCAVFLSGFFLYIIKTVWIFRSMTLCRGTTSKERTVNANKYYR